MVRSHAEGSKKEIEELTGVTKCYTIYGERSFPKMKQKMKIKTLQLHLSLFCSHLCGKNKTKYFY